MEDQYGNLIICFLESYLFKIFGTYCLILNAQPYTQQLNTINPSINSRFFSHNNDHDSLAQTDSLIDINTSIMSSDYLREYCH